MDSDTGKMIKPFSCIISSFTHHLMVYKEFNLIWAAKTNYISYGVRTGTFSK